MRKVVYMLHVHSSGSKRNGHGNECQSSVFQDAWKWTLNFTDLFKFIQELKLWTYTIRNEKTKCLVDVRGD